MKTVIVPSPNLAHHLRAGLRRLKSGVGQGGKGVVVVVVGLLKGGREPNFRGRGGEGRESGGWSLALRRDQLGSVEWMFLFLYGGNFVFDCCLYLSFRGLIPVGLDREIPLYVFACME